MRYFFNSKVFIFGITVAVIVILHYTGILTRLENAVIRAVNPVARIVFRTGSSLSGAEGEVMDPAVLAAQLALATRRSEELLAENISLRLLDEENKALREQLQFYTRHEYRKQLANVVSRSNEAGGTRFIVLDAGAAQGVTAGQAVIAGNGLVVGKIVSVTGELSYACVLTDGNCHLAAMSGSMDGPGGMTQGERGLTIRMDFVPQTQSLAAGDSVVTSGLEPAIPAGLIIGEVQEVRTEANNLFQTAVINPAAETRGLSIVSVIIN